MAKKAPTVVEVLQLAQMYVARGWIQGPVYDGEKCCAWGAMRLARLEVGLSEWGPYPGPRSSPAAILNEALPVRCRAAGYISFNEAPGRTQDEALDLFSKAIELAEKEAAK